MNKQIPAVSIIIAMYNAEKYIGECLDSILNQTFQDFEVIVVDDCSTDNSRAVVESYLPKFNRGGVEKLSLLCTEKNSGGGGFPRNIGIELSRGEYLSFIDADDMITKTALEELYRIAKKFDADVVHCERYIEFNDGEKNGTVTGYQSGELVKEPTLITENFAERIKDLYKKRFLWNLWTKLIRRDFIIKNHLKLANAKSYDVIFTTCLVASAKNYVRVPNIVNFYRVVKDSMSHRIDDIPKTIKKWVKAMTEGFNCIDKFLDGQKFFVERKDIKNLALEVWVKECCGYLNDIYAQIPAWQLEELIRRELEKLDVNANLTAFLFNRMNIFNVNLNRQGVMIRQMEMGLLEKDKLIRQMDADIRKQNEAIQTLQAKIKRLQQS